MVKELGKMPQKRKENSKKKRNQNQGKTQDVVEMERHGAKKQ